METQIIKSKRKTKNIQIKNNCNNQCTIEHFAEFKRDIKKPSNTNYFNYIIYFLIFFIIYQILKAFII